LGVWILDTVEQSLEKQASKLFPQVGYCTLESKPQNTLPDIAQLLP
jgi:hypothetical protein